MRRAAPLASLALAALLACSEPAGRTPGAAPPAPRAAVVIEPPQLRVGDVAMVEVAVTTPPGYALRPVTPPDAALLGPLWLLDAEALPVVKQDQRWLHRTRLRVRAREIGTGTWPSLALELIGPEGARTTLETEPRPFEVVSILPRHADRAEPFPLRLPARDAPLLSPLAAAAGGALAALAAVAAVAALRRGRARAAARAAQAGGVATPAPDAPWHEALAALAAAAAEAEPDWRAAADRCSAALRRYATRRWGFAIECRTTEELAELTPPFALALRWPEALGWLRTLDALRFRPAPAPDAAARVRQVAEQAQAWVSATIPPEVTAR
ncbi:MAG TPA: hypothetical protein VIN04_02105 [Myxococcota bacterium]